MSNQEVSQLTERGKKRTDWAFRQMPVLAQIRSRFKKELPFYGLRVGLCLHISAKTANLTLTLKEGGANVCLAASNPLSTQDDIAWYLREKGVEVLARRGEQEEEYRANLEKVLAFSPDYLIDDGADLIVLCHMQGIKTVRGATEETTTGITRLKNLKKAQILSFPVLGVNNALTKYLFDNRYGTGQSALDGILRATNILIAGSWVVVCGYGWVGKGVARRFQGMGARVIVTEVSPIRALEALMDGFQVLPMKKAAEIGDIFVTCTGNMKVISGEDLTKMKDGAILANAGHFNVEIDLLALNELSQEVKDLSPLIKEHSLKNGKRLFLLGEGRLVNLVCGEGHPAGVMDLSFSTQALSLEYLVRQGDQLEPGVYPVPEFIEGEIASLKLKSMGVEIDRLTPEQERYLASF
ncbi:MAG: adenosylhomocysteinase [bacterium]